MTNDTKAPERIWAGNWLGDCGETDWDIGEWRDEKWPTVEVVEYIHHDLHLSRVAAAYKDAADRSDCGCKADRSDCLAASLDTPICFREGVVDLHACTPADAQAALEARDKQIRDKALREALTIAGQAVKDAHTDEAQTYCNAVYDAIRALIEKEQTDE